MSSPLLSRRRLLGATAAAIGGLAFPLARAADDWQPVMLPQARQRDIVSTITGGQYRIFVNVPDTPAPAAGHPVLYALDGNASFSALALMARTAARRSQATKQPAPVIVGIGYPTNQDYDGPGRARDYTPPSGEGAPVGEGGADRFLDFIERELKPLVRSLAPLDANRQALFGHSYGGLCVLHALFTRPAMFQTWLAASPSIWYRDRVVLGELAGFPQRAATLSAKPSLMLAVGDLEQPAASSVALTGRDAINAQRRMVDNAGDLATRLQATNLFARVQSHVLPNENHGSVMLPAITRGLEFFRA